MGVSEYKLTKELPDELKDSFPTIEQIQNQIQKNVKNKFSQKTQST